MQETLWPVLLLLIRCTFCAIPLRAQYALDYNSGLKLNVNDREDYYFRFMIWNQIWARMIDQNPGTLINNVPQNRTFDIGARRMRLLMMAQLLPRFSERDKVRLQPFFAYSRKSLDALDQGGNYWDYGANMLIQQHNAKISFHYSQRPNNIATDRIDGQMGEFIVQSQTFL